MKKLNKGVLFLIILFSSMAASYGQSWTISVDIDLQTSDCFQEDVSSATYSFNGNINGTPVNISGAATPSDTQLFMATFSFSGFGSVGGTLSMTASGICNGPMPYAGLAIGASKSISISYPDHTNCSTTYYSVNPTPAPGQSGLAVNVVYTPARLAINDPSGADCHSQQVTLNSPSASDIYNWQVSADLTNWTSIGTTSIPSINVPFSSIGENGVYFARVGRVSACTFSSPSSSFTISSPPPTVTFSNVTGVSCFGLTDGKVKLTITPRSSIISSFLVSGRHESNSIGDDFQVSSGAVLEINNGVASLRPGNWSFTIANNTATSANGACEVIYANVITISEPNQLKILSPPPTANVSCNAADVGEKADGVITLNLENGTAPYGYEYSTNGGTSFTTIAPNDPNTLSPVFYASKGSYVFKAKYKSGSQTCESPVSQAISVREPDALSPSFGAIIDVKCRGKKTGSIDFNIVGGNGGYTYSWVGPLFTSADQDISGLGAGMYTVTITDAKGCQPGLSPLQKEIIQPDFDFTITPSKTSYGGFDVTCFQNDGRISLSLANYAAPPQSVTWKKNGESFSPLNSLYADNLSAANYSVTVIDNKDCEASASISLSPHPGITVVTEVMSHFNGYNTKCSLSDEGEGRVKSVINGFGSYSYLWSNATTHSTITDLQAGSYTVTVTDGNGCSDSEAILISSPPAIQPHLQVTSNYNGTQISCPTKNDGRIEAFPVNGFGTGSGANYHFSWSHDVSVATKFAKNLSQGSYKVTVTDDYGCSSEESLVLIDPPAMVLNLTNKNYHGADVSCHDSTDGEIQLTVLNGAAPHTYSWSDGKTTKDNVGVSAGSYMVTAKDANACTQSKSTTLANPLALVVRANHVNNFNGFDISCHSKGDGATIAVATGGTGAYHYSWSNGARTSSNQTLFSGAYTVVVTDDNGCSANDEIYLNEPSVLSLTGSIDNPVSCFGLSDGAVSVNGTGGVTPYNYSIDVNDPHSWRNESVFSSLPYGAQEFYVKDKNGCQAAMQKSIPQPDPLELEFENIVPATCNEAVGSASALVSGGNEGFIFKWSDEITVLGSESILKNVTAGIYKVEIEDSKRCTITDQVAISSIGGAGFIIDSVVGVSCFGFNDGASAISVTSGVEPYSFAWSDGQSMATVSGLASGKYFITVTDGLGCKTIKQVDIPTPQLLSSKYSTTIPLCAGDCNGTIEVLPKGGTAPYTYDWAGINQSTSVATGLCANTYEIKISDARGCMLTDKVELKNPEPLKISAVLTKPICLGRCDGSISLSGTGGNGTYLFEWEGGATTSLLTNLCPGDYNVQMNDSNNCKVSDEFTVLPSSPLALDLGTKATLCVGQIKVLDPGPQWVSSIWSSNNNFSSNSSKISIQDPGLYYFNGIDALGCIAMDTFKLETSLDLLKAEFLMPAEAVVGDTIVAIDISWPLPEKIEWNYPPSFKILPSAVPELSFIQPLESGVYSISMKSFLAQCRDVREKQLTVLAKEKRSSGGRLGYEELIKEFTLFPNPNNGKFQAKVSLSEPSEILMRVIQFPLGIVKLEYYGKDLHDYLIDFDLNDLPQGMYMLMLKVGDQDQLIRFVKN